MSERNLVRLGIDLRYYEPKPLPELQQQWLVAHLETASYTFVHSGDQVLLVDRRALDGFVEAKLAMVEEVVRETDDVNTGYLARVEGQWFKAEGISARIRPAPEGLESAWIAKQEFAFTLIESFQWLSKEQKEDIYSLVAQPDVAAKFLSLRHVEIDLHSYAPEQTAIVRSPEDGQIVRLKDVIWFMSANPPTMAVLERDTEGNIGVGCEHVLIVIAPTGTTADGITLVHDQCSEALIACGFQQRGSAYVLPNKNLMGYTFDGSVMLTRYGQLVAYLPSPDKHTFI